MCHGEGWRVPSIRQATRTAGSLSPFSMSLHFPTPQPLVSLVLPHPSPSSPGHSFPHVVLISSCDAAQDLRGLPSVPVLCTHHHVSTMQSLILSSLNYKLWPFFCEEPGLNFPHRLSNEKRGFSLSSPVQSQPQLMDQDRHEVGSQRPCS